MMVCTGWDYLVECELRMLSMEQSVVLGVISQTH